MIVNDIVKIIIEKNEKINNNNDPSKLDKYDINLINSLLNSYTLNNNFFIHKKYKYFNDILNNIFVENDMKDFFLECIQKIQNIYFSLNRFAFLYKFKKAKIIVQEDLYMNFIEPNAKNSIWIYQEKNKYLFILSDLINILNIALSNSPYFFSEPLSCKNPYNNIPFNKSTLYNIYFYILKYNKLVPMLFHLFFLSNFNLLKFKEDNEYFIREYAILDYVKTKDENVLFKDINNMLYYTIIEYNKKIRIDNNFPKKKLVKIMKPYLLLYFKSKYSLCFHSQVQNGIELKNKLEKFYKYSPMFGRKKIELIEVYSSLRKKNIIKKKVYFIEKCILFNFKEENFLQSHVINNNIVLEDNDENDHEEEEDGDDDEDEYEETEEEMFENDEDITIPEMFEDSENDDDTTIPQIPNTNVISYHTDVDSDYFNEIFNQLYEIEDGFEEETKDEDSIS